MTEVATALLGRFAVPVPVAEKKTTAQPAPKCKEEDPAVQEWFMQKRAAAASTPQPPTEKTPAQPRTSHVSAFERLEYREESPSQGGQFRTHSEMTPQKVERGWQPECCTEQKDKSVGRSEKEPGRSNSQKRRSQSRGRDEVDSKRGCTDMEKKIKVRIDWSTTGIRKPNLKPDPQHPSFRPDPGRSTASPPDPHLRSTVSRVLANLPASLEIREVPVTRKTLPQRSLL